MESKLAVIVREMIKLYKENPLGAHANFKTKNSLEIRENSIFARYTHKENGKIYEIKIYEVKK